MQVALNGSRREVADGTTVADAVALLLGDRPARGVAVAVDDDVVCRDDWDTVLADGQRVEVIAAVQGG